MAALGRKSLVTAKVHKDNGELAHLVERLLCTQEVRSSSLLFSTINGLACTKGARSTCNASVVSSILIESTNYPQPRMELRSSKPKGSFRLRVGMPNARTLGYHNIQLSHQTNRLRDMFGISCNLGSLWLPYGLV